MKKFIFYIFLVSIAVGCKNEYSDLEEGLYANMETDKGSILLKLYFEDVPITTANFVALAEGNHPNVVDSLAGKPFFNELGFHRVIKDFMVESGDPTGDGKGNAGYQFFDEIPRDSTGKPKYKHDGAGVLSMSQDGRRRNTNGSRFFITHKPTPWLDGVNTVFGEVYDGMPVVDSIALYDMIQNVNIIRVGSKAQNFNAPKVFKKGTSEYFAEQEAKRLKEEADLKKFLETMDAHKESARETSSGLRILVLKKGDSDGKKFNRAQRVFIDYTVRLEDGGRLIQTTENTEPYGFIMNEQPMISGVTEAIERMREGDKYRLFIPYYLAYGETGRGSIPPKANLVFDLEIVKIGE
jgi:cyclophilin family peptidyl-prolyl cis-trans isomerase